MFSSNDLSAARVWQGSAMFVHERIGVLLARTNNLLQQNVVTDKFTLFNCDISA
jgi:hypothetical protein